MHRHLVGEQSPTKAVKEEVKPPVLEENKVEATPEIAEEVATPKKTSKKASK